MAGETERRNRVLEKLACRYPSAATSLIYKNPFELLVATVLSAQSTDEQVNKTTRTLFRKYPNPATLAAADLSQLETAIRGCGLYRTKSRNLIKLARALVDKHNSCVPADFDALMALAGVGRKTANVVLQNAFGISALAVDTHVFRVSRRLGLTAASQVAQVEEELKSWIPRELWGRVHHWLIAHGRQVCRAPSPRCRECFLLKECPTGRQARETGRE